MENIQQGNGNGGVGADAFARTADALLSAADSLATEFQRREQADAAAAKKAEQERTELKQKLVNIKVQIGALLGNVGGTVATTTVKRGRPVGSKNKPAESQRGRAMNEETVKAKDKVLAFITANKGVSRGDIARNCKLDTSLVGRVLQMLADEGSAKMAGERRGATWSAK